MEAEPKPCPDTGSAADLREEMTVLKEKIWSVLLHLGGNMWNEEGITRGRENSPDAVASPELRFSRAVWDRQLERLASYGVNMIVLDLGEGLRYESHPELAVRGSWTQEEMAKEIAHMQSMGFEVVPKLNFSACHDVWLGEYSRMLSTRVYYEVCADLIREVSALFKPRFFHLGMDEETAAHQRDYDYCVIRQHDLWWHDFYYLMDCVEREGARAWIWSDYMWHHRDVFLKKMPKSVMQSNWYYNREFGGPELSEGLANMLTCFDELDRAGYEQIPTGSNWSCRENMELLTMYCAEHIADERLAGFMQTPWMLTLESTEDHLNEAADALYESRQHYERDRAARCGV
jgi:hypothetical protein